MAPCGDVATGRDIYSSNPAPTYLPTVIAATTTLAHQTYPRLSAACSSGNCQWTPFSSLALCVAMNDVTSLLNISENSDGSGLKASLPNGVLLNTNTNLALVPAEDAFQQVIITPRMVAALPFMAAAPDPGPSALWNANQTLSFGNQTDLFTTGLFDLSLIFSPGNMANMTSGDETFQAVEILFYFCVETYEVNTKNGTTLTNITAADPASDLNLYEVDIENGTTLTNITPAAASHLNLNIYASWLGGYDHQNYTIDSYSILDLQQDFLTFFNGTYSRYLGQSSTPLSLSLGLSLYSGNDTDSQSVAEMHQSIKNIMENIAIGFTNMSVFIHPSNFLGWFGGRD